MLSDRELFLVQKLAEAQGVIATCRGILAATVEPNQRLLFTARTLLDTYEPWVSHPDDAVPPEVVPNYG